MSSKTVQLNALEYVINYLDLELDFLVTSKAAWDTINAKSKELDRWVDIYRKTKYV